MYLVRDVWRLTVLPVEKVFYLNHAYCKCINSDKGGTGESPKIVASIKWAKS